MAQPGSFGQNGGMSVSLGLLGVPPSYGPLQQARAQAGTAGCSGHQRRLHCFSRGGGRGVDGGHQSLDTWARRCWLPFPPALRLCSARGGLGKKGQSSNSE